MHSNPLQAFSSHRAACKQWSATLGVLILLVGGLAGLNPTKMLWAAGPLLLLGLVEAGYAAQERRCAELLKAKKGNEETTVLLPEPASASIVRTTFAAMSLSIWPFYLGLFVLVAVGGEQMSASNAKVVLASGAQNLAPAGLIRTAAANKSSSGGCGSGCSSSGGCGSSGACGSGGCGSGKGCSSGGAATTMARTQVPVQQSYHLVPSSYPMPQPQIQGAYPQQQIPQPQMFPQQQQAPQYSQQAPMQSQQFPQPPQMPQRLPNGTTSAPITARPPAFPTNPSAARTLAAPLQPPAAAPAAGPDTSSAPPQPSPSIAAPSPEAASTPAPATTAPKPAAPSVSKKH